MAKSTKSNVSIPAVAPPAVAPPVLAPPTVAPPVVSPPVVVGKVQNADVSADDFERIYRRVAAQNGTLNDVAADILAQCPGQLRLRSTNAIVAKVSAKHVGLNAQIAAENAKIHDYLTVCAELGEAPDPALGTYLLPFPVLTQRQARNNKVNERDSAIAAMRAKLLAAK